MTETKTEEREFIAWPKIPRLNRDIYITEKIDGTNACIVITRDDIYAQSRKRIISVESDNMGFAKWVQDNAYQLREQLGEGRHFGEWWGKGVQGGYQGTMEEKRFSLFNAQRWVADPEDGYRAVEAPLCHVVPLLKIHGRMDTDAINEVIEDLRENGSKAAPGGEAEGIIVYHRQGNLSFKFTFQYDEKGKAYGA